MSLFRGAGLGSNTRLFRGAGLGSNASLFHGAGFGSNAGFFCGTGFGGNTRLFCGTGFGSNTGSLLSLRFGSGTLLFGQQGFIDDHRLQIGGTLLHHQRTMVVQLGRWAAIIVQNGILCAGGHFSRHGRRRIGNGSGGSSDLRLSGNRGGLRCLDSLSLFFLAAETQPGKQTFCHLKILTSKADC